MMIVVVIIAAPTDCQVARGRTGALSNEHLCAYQQLSSSVMWPVSKQTENRNSQVIDIYSEYTTNYLQKYYGLNYVFS